MGLMELIDTDNTVLNACDESRPVKPKRNDCNEVDIDIDATSQACTDVDTVPVAVPVDHPLLADLTSALVNLGWPKRHAISHAKDTLALQSDISISQAIKLALKQQ